MEDNYFYRYVDMWGDFEGGQLSFRDFELGGDMPTMILLMPLEDYIHISGEFRQLGSDDMLFYASGFDVTSEFLTVNEKTFQLEEMNESPAALNTNALFGDALILVAPDTEVIESIMSFYNENIAEYPIRYSADYFWSTAEEDEDGVYASMIEDELWETDYPIGVFYESREGSREEWYNLNGGFVFIGIFLGGLFTIGAVLITYYKQVSEGYEDRERIQIMQKVGLDKETTRKATYSQILWMFSLPILTAALHTAFAYPIVQKLLVIFSIMNNRLFLGITVGVVLVYAFIYWIIYRVTSRMYLNIVE